MLVHLGEHARSQPLPRERVEEAAGGDRDGGEGREHRGDAGQRHQHAQDADVVVRDVVDGRELARVHVARHGAGRHRDDVPERRDDPVEAGADGDQDRRLGDE